MITGNTALRTFGIYAALALATTYLVLYLKLTDKSVKINNTGVFVLQDIFKGSGENISHLTKSKEVDHFIASATNPIDIGEKPTSYRPPEKSSNTTLKPKSKKDDKKKLIILKELKLRSESEIKNDLEVTYDINNLSLAQNCSFWNDKLMPPYTRICSQKNVDNETLITLFTTLHYSEKDVYILNNTIRLWSQLGPKIRRIVFVSSPHAERHLVKMACNADWDVITAPLCDRNKLPVLKAMFMAAQQLYKSTFYGYANGDVLYDESLINTLEFVKANYLKYFKKTLFVGRRTNIKLQPKQTISDLEELRILAKNGTDGWVAAVDYFISSRNGFDWEGIPKVVVGRIAYDNWMIWHARKMKFAVFDITNSTLSAHQWTDKYYGSHKKKDAGINHQLVGRFDFTKGLISCSQLKTKIEENTIKLKIRVKYGMCGQGHWAKRIVSRYGDEIEAYFEPGMKL